MEEKPRCNLIGKNGNIFNLMGLSSKVLKKAGQEDKAEEMTKKIMEEAESYSQALCIISNYVEVR